jgi:hypothetical protein
VENYMRVVRIGHADFAAAPMNSMVESVPSAAVGSVGRRVRSTVDGFDSFSLGPSPSLKRLASNDDPRIGEWFASAWIEIGRAIAQAIESLAPAIRDHS